MDDRVPLEVNDRVSRPGVFANDPPRLGRVIEVYRSTPNGLGKGDTLYAVEWDDGTTARGYLRVGLTWVARTMPVDPATAFSYIESGTEARLARDSRREALGTRAGAARARQVIDVLVRTCSRWQGTYETKGEGTTDARV